MTAGLISSRSSDAKQPRNKDARLQMLKSASKCVITTNYTTLRND